MPKHPVDRAPSGRGSLNRASWPLCGPLSPLYEPTSQHRIRTPAGAQEQAGGWEGDLLYLVRLGDSLALLPICAGWTNSFLVSHLTNTTQASPLCQAVCEG